MSYRIVCIGEPLAEIARGIAGLSVGFGGDTLNTAIYCARSCAAFDITVDYFTAVGQDVLSQGAIDLMIAEGVGVDHVRQFPDRQIGIYAIQTDENGERSFHYWRDASAARRMFAAGDASHLAAIEGADLIYLSGISIAILQPDARERLWSALADARSRGSVVAFDSNYRPQLWQDVTTAREQIALFWEVTDIALPSIEDEAVLFGTEDPAEVMARLRGAGVTAGVLKRGALGPVSLDPAAAKRDFPASEAVVDTTGAGDSFNGAYLAAYAADLPLDQAVSLAHDLARRIVGHRGAILPKDADLKPV